MCAALAQPLFYNLAVSRSDLFSLVSGLSQPPAIDTVEFPDEQGGEAIRELAIPYLPGMDEIQVDQAQMRFRAGQMSLEIEDFSAAPGPGGRGVVLSLPTAARLLRVELTYAPPPPPPGKTTRLVVRPAQDGGFGPPQFAYPDFDRPGPMFPRVLTGLQVQELGGDRRVVTLPRLMGTSWLLQVAFAAEAAELDPQALVPGISRVTIDALPQNLSITLAGNGEETPLWGNQQVLLPESGEQEVSFTPLAQRRLADELKASAANRLTLPLTLRFRSDTAGRVEVTSRTLAARYLQRPLGQEPMTLRLGGGHTPLALLAPAGLKPFGSSLRLTARSLGRALNAASPVAPLALPSSGLRVTLDRNAAAALAFSPLSAADPPGTVLPLASVRLCLSAEKDAEAVLELRADVAGAPGPAVAAPIVSQLKGGWSGWVEFEPPQPIPVAAGQAPLWLALRVTKGEVMWFFAPDSIWPPVQGSSGPAAGTAKVSTDKGATWGSPGTALLPPAGLLAQLYHLLPEPLPAPEVRLQRGDAVLVANWLAGAAQTGPKEFVRTDAAFPAAVHQLLTLTSGQGKAETRLQLFSAQVLDLTIENLALSYDPFDALQPAS